MGKNWNTSYNNTPRAFLRKGQAVLRGRLCPHEGTSRGDRPCEITLALLVFSPIKRGTILCGSRNKACRAAVFGSWLVMSVSFLPLLVFLLSLIKNIFHILGWNLLLCNFYLMTSIQMLQGTWNHFSVFREASLPALGDRRLPGAFSSPA